MIRAFIISYMYVCIQNAFSSFSSPEFITRIYAKLLYILRAPLERAVFVDFIGHDCQVLSRR